jgi:hypothetical protein
LRSTSPLPQLPSLFEVCIRETTPKSFIAALGEAGECVRQFASWGTRSAALTIRSSLMRLRGAIVIA